MRYCAAQEINKATKQTDMRTLKELVLIRSLKNQWRDLGMKWLNTLAVAGLYKPGKRE